MKLESVWTPSSMPARTTWHPLCNLPDGTFRHVRSVRRTRLTILTIGPHHDGWGRRTGNDEMHGRSGCTGRIASIVVIVLGCRWLCDAAGAGVFAVLALAVPYSLPVVSATLREAMSSR